MQAENEGDSLPGFQVAGVIEQKRPAGLRLGHLLGAGGARRVEQLQRLLRFGAGQEQHRQLALDVPVLVIFGTADPRWEGKGNRDEFKDAVQYGIQDFGYSPSTNHAGKGQGELGGLTEADFNGLSAGCFATLVIAIAAPPLAEVALKFGPAEYFSLMVFGLIAATVLAHGSLTKAIAMVVFGLLLGLIGTDVNSGVLRFTFDIPELSDGIGFVVVAMGIRPAAR